MNQLTRCLCLAALGAASALSAAQAQTFNVLHSFVGGAADGTQPFDGVILDGGTLFGTTGGGGAANGGAVFKIGIDGKGFGLLHSFAGGANDGLEPIGNLTLNGSTLYGMTAFGGSTANGGSGYGTIFSMQLDGSGYHVVHSFAGGNDGAVPAFSALAVIGATLYGMTEDGGTSHDGNIFKVGIDGSGDTVLHSFTGGMADGADPHGGLTVVGTTLYGTTKIGGRSDYGTLFKIGADGSGFNVLHSFAAADGVWPCGDVTLNGTTLYGTAQQGGGHSPYGTVFKIATDGSGYGVLHSFDYDNPNDGAYPVGDLTISGQTLFGTTASGLGTSTGIVFQMGIDGTGFTRLH
jgi:uncharacterized repeat protein (TIGR03803 family)